MSPAGATSLCQSLFGNFPAVGNCISLTTATRLNRQHVFVSLELQTVVPKAMMTRATLTDLSNTTSISVYGQFFLYPTQPADALFNQKDTPQSPACLYQHLQTSATSKTSLRLYVPQSPARVNQNLQTSVTKISLIFPQNYRPQLPKIGTSVKQTRA